MTTISMNTHSFASYAAERSPRKSFAGHLAELQARHEQAPRLAAVVGAASRLALAAIPFGALAYLFVYV